MIIIRILFDDQKNGFVFSCDDGRELLVSYDVYQILSLHAPAEPTAEQEELLVSEDARFRAFSIGLRYASYKPRTANEVKQRLRRDKIPTSVQEQVVEKLTNHGWLDDGLYACRYIQEKQRKGWSRRHIAAALREKGIDYALINRILEEIPASDEQEVLRLLVEKKYARRDLTEEKEFNRTVQALCRRGFSVNDVLHVLKEGNKQ